MREPSDPNAGLTLNEGERKAGRGRLEGCLRGQLDLKRLEDMLKSKQPSGPPGFRVSRNSLVGISA